MAMIEVLRSGVNTWECDQMGHLNVRHYFRLTRQGLSMLLLRIGLPPSRLRELGVVPRVRDQHVRFHREMRPGTPYAVRAGVLQASATGLRVYCEIHVVTTGELSATSVSQVALCAPDRQEPLSLRDDMVAQAHALACELPEAAAPRGIELTPPRPAPTLAQATALGMIGAYLGPVTAEDCDDNGRMTEAAFMARVSDGIPHFFVAVREGLRPDGIGGAALEYRFVFHDRPRLGDLIEVRSGLKCLGKKTIHIVHGIFDVESGRCAAVSEAVAVSFDLTTRKSVEIPEEARAVMVGRILPGLGV